MENEGETKYLLKQTPVKTPNKQTARMRFGGDTRKLQLKQIKKRTQGVKSKWKPPRRYPKDPQGPPVDAQDLVKEAMNTMQNTDAQDEYLHTHSISGKKFSNKVQGFPIRQKLAQGPKASIHAKNNSRVATSALKEENIGRVQNRAKKMLNKAKVMKQTKGRSGSNKTEFVKELFERNSIEGAVLPFYGTTKYHGKGNITKNIKISGFKSKGSRPRFGKFLDQKNYEGNQEAANVVFGCSGDSDNENIPLNKLKQIQKSKLAKQSPLVAKTSGAKKKKGTVLVSREKNAATKVKEEKGTKLKSVPEEGMVTPQKRITLHCFKPVVQVVDISPLIDRTKVTQGSDLTETSSVASESTRRREVDFYGGADLANTLVWEEECDDYELVEMMERTDVLDCCSRSTSPSEKVAVFSHSRGQYMYVPKSHPSLHAAPLPHVEQLDIPDAIRANILYQKAKEAEGKDYEREKEMVLNYGYQWMKVPVGGPRYPPSTLRHLAKVNRTSTEYWRQMHTPSARFAEAKKRLFSRRAPTSTVTRAEAHYRPEQYGVSRKCL